MAYFIAASTFMQQLTLIALSIYTTERMAILIQGVPEALRLVGDAALSPTLLVLTLVFLTYGLPHLIVKITGSEFIARGIDVFGLKTALKVLVSLGIGHVGNRILNLRASNNWSLFGQGRWIWPEEIAVVTVGATASEKPSSSPLSRRVYGSPFSKWQTFRQNLHRLTPYFTENATSLQLLL